jgi:hypothetical protein
MSYQCTANEDSGHERGANPPNHVRFHGEDS